MKKYAKNASDYAIKLSESRSSGIYTECLLGKRWIYVPIDKCASNSIKKSLFQKGFVPMESIIDHNKAFQRFKNFNHFAVVRHPEERYISSLCEFMRRHPKKLGNEYIAKCLKNNKFMIDDHTFPMVCTINFIDNPTLFKLDDNISEKLSEHIKTNLNIKILNKSFSCHKESAQELFDKYCKNNPEFHQFCKDDFDIWESAC